MYLFQWWANGKWFVHNMIMYRFEQESLWQMQADLKLLVTKQFYLVIATSLRTMGDKARWAAGQFSSCVWQCRTLSVFALFAWWILQFVFLWILIKSLHVKHMYYYFIVWSIHIYVIRDARIFAPLTACLMTRSIEWVTHPFSPGHIGDN